MVRGDGGGVRRRGERRSVVRWGGEGADGRGDTSPGGGGWRKRIERRWMIGEMRLGGDKVAKKQRLVIT